MVDCHWTAITRPPILQGGLPLDTKALLTRPAQSTHPAWWTVTGYQGTANCCANMVNSTSWTPGWLKVKPSSIVLTIKLVAVHVPCKSQHCQKVYTCMNAVQLNHSGHQLIIPSADSTCQVCLICLCIMCLSHCSCMIQTVVRTMTGHMHNYWWLDHPGPESVCLNSEEPTLMHQGHRINIIISRA